MPCFAVGLVSFTAALCSIFFVEETLPAIAAKKYHALQDTEDAAKQIVLAFRGTATPTDWNTDLDFPLTALTGTATASIMIGLY